MEGYLNHAHEVCGSVRETLFYTLAVVSTEAMRYLEILPGSFNVIGICCTHLDH